MEKAFVQNRTSKKDQLFKLREVLRGQAKWLVPDTTVTTIEKAWEVLEDAFGDAIRVMRQRKKAFHKLGALPKGYKAQVEWYIQAECLIAGILDLGRQTSKLEKEAFSDSTIRTIKTQFPDEIQKKLNKLPGDEDDLLEAILDKVKKLRVEAQGMVKNKEMETQNGGKAEAGKRN